MSLSQTHDGLVPAVLQLNFSGGQARENGPFVLARQIRVDGSPAYVFLAAEAGGPYPEDTCQALADSLLSLLCGGRTSVSGRLQEALNGAHQHLTQENARSLPPHQAGLNAVCALLRPAGTAQGEWDEAGNAGSNGCEVLVALGGAALALSFSEAGVLDICGASGAPVLPLGVYGSQVLFRRHLLPPGERLLLLSSNALLEGPKDPLLGAFCTELEGGMAHLFRRADRAPVFGAVAFEQRSQAALAQPPAAASPAGPRPYSYGPGLPPGNHVPEVRPAVPPAPAPVRMPISLDLRRPVTSARRGRVIPSRLFAGAGILLAIVALYAGLQSAAQEREAQAEAHAAALVVEASDLVDEAGNAPDGDSRRRLLTDASRRIDAVQRQEPENREAVQLAGRIEEAIDQLNAVHSLRDLRPILEASTLPGSQTLYRDLVEQNGDLYLLDKGGDKVLHLPASALDAGSFQAASVYQARAGAGAGRSHLAALLRLAPGGAWRRDSLLALDENRGLLEVQPGAEARMLPLRGAPEWGSFQAAAGFEGSLYILDPKDSQVYRYVPTEAGFDTERRPVLPSVDLRDAVDLAVDGDVYVLLRTGRVLKFSGNRPQPFSLDGLDPPMSGQGALFADSGPTLYVADAGNRRVVAFEKEGGRFLRQFPTGDLGQVHGLWVHEPSRRLYLVTDTRVYAATLP